MCLSGSGESTISVIRCVCSEYYRCTKKMALYQGNFDIGPGGATKQTTKFVDHNSYNNPSPVELIRRGYSQLQNDASNVDMRFTLTAQDGKLYQTSCSEICEQRTLPSEINLSSPFSLFSCPRCHFVSKSEGLEKEQRTNTSHSTLQCCIPNPSISFSLDR